MYRYEEMNLQELMANDTLDPESAEVLYAMAQCYRLGKGTEVDMELYKKALEGAADAGSETAAEELKVLTEQEKHVSNSNEEKVQRDLTTLPIDELMDLARADDIEACCEVYCRYGKEESRYLIHAAELIDQGNHSLNKEECQKILETLADHYLNNEKDTEKAMEAYGKSAELGSAAACWKLVELCADEQQKMFYAKKAANIGSDKDMYRYAEILRKVGRRAEADACLEKLLKQGDLDETLKMQIKMWHHTEAEEKEVVQFAWSHVEELPCKEFLGNYYGTDPAELFEDQLPTDEQAYKLADLHRGARWKRNPWYVWMQWAAERGNEKAIAEVQVENEIRRREYEEELKRKERIEEQNRIERIKNMKKYPEICITGDKAVKLSIYDCSGTNGMNDSMGMQFGGIRYGTVIISAVMEVDAFHKLGYDEEDIADWNNAIKRNPTYSEDIKEYLQVKFNECKDHIIFPSITYGYNSYCVPMFEADSFEHDYVDNDVREYMQSIYKNGRKDVYHAMLITDYSFSPFADSKDERKFFANHLRELIRLDLQQYCDHIGVVVETDDHLAQSLSVIGFKKLSPTSSVYSARMDGESDDNRGKKTNSIITAIIFLIAIIFLSVKHMIGILDVLLALVIFGLGGPIPFFVFASRLISGWLN